MGWKESQPSLKQPVPPLFLFLCFCLMMPMRMMDRQRQIQAVVEDVGGTEPVRVCGPVPGGGR